MSDSGGYTESYREPSTSGRGTRGDDVKSVARRAIEGLWQNGNLQAVDEFYAPNYVDHTPQTGVSPNRDGVKKTYSLLHKAFPDLNTSVKDLIAEGDRVCALVTAHGTNQGDLMGIPPTGKSMTLEGCVINRISNGKIVESWEFFDQSQYPFNQLLARANKDE